MEQLYCNNWTELTSKIKEAKEILGNPKTVWYRGQSNSLFTLVPSLFRIPDGLQREQEVFNRFKQIASRIQAEGKDDWELLFSMQHYWIPTRLLDWSEVVGVPLFFASKYNQTFEGKEAISLYVLDPLQMNLKSQKHNIPQLPGLTNFNYQKIYFEKDPFAATFPIAIIPNFNHNRLLAQRGVFTVHPDTHQPIEELCPDCLVKIIIPKSVIPEILEFLEIANVDEMTIFPDMQGAAEYLKSLLWKSRK
jgi:FRG domain